MRLFPTVSTFALALATTSAARIHNITVIDVGANVSAPGGPVQFVPPSVNATKGSIVTFRFSGLIAGNHTVTQGSFDSPCESLDGGFNSGWIYIPPNTTSGFPEWNLTITNDTKPIWFICKQLSQTNGNPHCWGGMVGAINAPTLGNETFAAYQNASRNSTVIPPQFGDGRNVGKGAFATTPPGPFPPGGTGYSLPTDIPHV